MRQISAPISLAGSQLGQTRHVCAFFNNDEEEYRVLLPFIKDGFERGDKAIHIVSPDQHRHCTGPSLIDSRLAIIWEGSRSVAVLRLLQRWLPKALSVRHRSSSWIM